MLCIFICSLFAHGFQSFIYFSFFNQCLVFLCLMKSKFYFLLNSLDWGFILFIVSYAYLVHLFSLFNFSDKSI